jgi:hypothetical protein
VLPVTRLSFTSFEQVYATAYDALRRGDTTHIHILFDSLVQSRRAFDTTPMARMMPEIGSSMDVMTNELRAMLLLRAGKPDEAIGLMGQTAARDDGMPFEFGPPDIPKPTHELLGESRPLRWGVRPR